MEASSSTAAAHGDATFAPGARVIYKDGSSGVVQKAHHDDPEGGVYYTVDLGPGRVINALHKSLRPQEAVGAAAGAAAGAGATLTASQTDVLGLLSGVLTALPAVAPPPLNMCLMPFTIALAKLGLAVRQVRFNKEAVVLLQRRGVEIAQKLQDVVKATQGLPTGRVEAVARTVTAIGQALDEAAKFIQQFSKKGAFAKLLSGSLDARQFGLLDKRLCELSNELGSALDLQQLALQAQRFEKIEGLIQLLGQQTVDANNQAAAQRAAIMCGIERGSAIEHEEFSALGLKLDQIAADVSTVMAGVQQLLANEGAAQERFVYDPYDSDDSDQEASLLGEGSFGTTHRMRNTDDGLVYAVKLMKIKKTTKMGVPVEKLQQEAVRLVPAASLQGRLSS